MNVTSKIVADLTRPNIGARVNAVQGDGNTRLAEITLLCGGVTWTPPDGVEAAIAYMQPGGTKGLYNKLADGTAAISISGNVATVILAPQMLTVSGTVQASLVFNDAQLNRLTTFPFAVSVTSNPAAGAQKTEDYIRLQWLEDKLDEYIAKVGGGSAVDPEAVRQIVINYLTANPPTVEETDPTVPAWAKQPQKPAYTAAEVGALPDTYTPPIATETTLGGVKPVTATNAMTQPVGVTAEGRLVTKPGDGGSGISVTGATVGQTVKIAAVDDNGVPTAWEPVDFPSGRADAWELIANGTTGDESTALDITKDNDGQTFELKRWYLRMQISPITVNTDNTANYLSSFMYTNKQNLKTCQNNVRANSNQIRYYQCFGEPIPGAGLIFAQSLSTQPYNNALNLGNMSYYYSAIDSHCFGLRIGFGWEFNAYVFGAGSEYYLYGVRV